MMDLSCVSSARLGAVQCRCSAAPGVGFELGCIVDAYVLYSVSYGFDCTVYCVVLVGGSRMSLRV